MFEIRFVALLGGLLPSLFKPRFEGPKWPKQLFTWLSLVVSLMASFVLSFFPVDVLDEIWDLLKSVSEGFLSYSYPRGSWV